MAIKLSGSAFARSLFTMSLLLVASSSIAAATTTAPVSASRDLDYRLGAGDRVRVITFGEPSLTGEFEVSGLGTISLPLIGDVKADGSTTGQLQERITAALKNGYMTNPSVNVEVLSYRPFYILGEVNKPGQYPYSAGSTVMTAVATASGFTYRANKHKVMIKHNDRPDSQKFALDPNTPVLPGDTITVLERHF